MPSRGASPAPAAGTVPPSRPAAARAPALPRAFTMDAVEEPEVGELLAEAIEAPMIPPATDLVPPPAATPPTTLRPTAPVTPPPATAPPAPPAAAPPAPVAAPVPAAPPPRTLALEAALAAIEAADSRDRIGEALRDVLRGEFACGLVLVCRQDLALGWKGFAPDEGGLESIALPLMVPSVLRAAYQARATALAPPSAEGKLLDERLWKLLGVEPPRAALVSPIAINDRVVNLVYAHPRAGAEPTPAALAGVTRLAAAAAAAYVRLIQQAKPKA
jgi:hypothetical protein